MMATEKRLIDANALKEYLNSIEASGGHKYYRKGMDDVLHFHMPNIIEDAPTVDAVEVVHGRWEDVQETEMYVPDMKFTITKTAETCSACKARIGFIGAKQYLFDAVCPNCGAKMDGDWNA